MKIDELKQISIKEIKGIGDKNGSLFARLGIESLFDLLYCFPRDYKKLPPIVKANELIEGSVCAVRLTVSDDVYFKKTTNNAITTLSAYDDTGRVFMTFFRVTYIRSVLKPGSTWVFLGKVVRKGTKFAFEMPEIIKVNEYIDNFNSLQAIYPLTKGITSKTISKYVKQTLDSNSDLVDSLPNDISKELNFCTLREALYGIHFPKDSESKKLSKDRLAFEEFYRFFKGLKDQADKYNRLESQCVFIETAEYERFKEVLPYELTNGQKNALKDIVEDLTGGFVMNRLVQGDVGSGKTIVAFLACLLCASNGYQAAFMAPTEVLASQHYKNFCELNDRYNLGLNITFLSGSLTASQKRKISDSLERNEFNLVVGTHALFQEGVKFSSLALAVTDEQHRFGVEQRNLLENKGIHPHVLSLSATPIPRTLAEVYYTGLQVSVISDKPKNRIPVKTGVRIAEERVDGLRFLYSKVKEGQQAMVVCPMIEENENVDLSNVFDYADYLKDLMPKDIRIGILHGRMKNLEKTRVMNYFANGDIDILVSTTVIEVGIDVPNATVILIENAERFGLATLHQLRGRVGRGDKASYCILINGSKSNEDNERLDVLMKSDDGFFIADEDLRLRGPGDLLGVRQSGDFQFLIGDLYRDRDLFIKAKEYVDRNT